MNRNILLILIAVVLVGGIVYSYSDTATTRVEEFVATPPVTTTTPIINNDIEFDLNSQNNSGQSGRAVLMDQNGMVQLAINLTGEQDGASQPAHIHLGTCENLGDVLYPLNNVVNGQSVTTLSVTMEQLKSMMPLAVNVHKSVDEMDNYVACGDVKT